MTDLTPAKLEVVGNYRTRMEAELAAGLLADAGISCLIQSGEGMGILMPSGADLLVRHEDASRARDILRRLRVVRGDEP